MAGYRLSAAAQADIVAILAWHQEQFGEAARSRYEALVVAALRDIAIEAHRGSSIERPELGKGIRSWHLRLSRERARTKTGMVRRPRHFLIYRKEDDLIVIGRVLHDAMELAKHLDSQKSWE